MLLKGNEAYGFTVGSSPACEFVGQAEQN